MTPRPTLAERRRARLQAVYAIICRRYQETGYGVTLREVQRDMGFNSANTASYWINRLLLTGLIANDYATHRSLRPVVLGYATVQGREYSISPVGAW